MTRARGLKIISISAVLLITAGAIALWTYGSGERTYYGTHTGVLQVGDSVVIADDVSTPEGGALRKTTRGVVQADPAWDEDSCYPDRLIAVQLTSGQRVSVPRHVLHR